MDKDKPIYKAIREASRKATDEFAKVLSEIIQRDNIDSALLKEAVLTENVHTGILHERDIYLPVFYRVSFGPEISEEDYKKLVAKMEAQCGETDVFVNSEQIK